MFIPFLKLVVCFWTTDNKVFTLKLFAHDTSIFSAVNDANISADELNKDLQKISEQGCKWKILFNPGFRYGFSRKLNKSNHPKIYFNNEPVFCANWQNHLGIYLDDSLNFNYHIKEKCLKQ